MEIGTVDGFDYLKGRLVPATGEREHTFGGALPGLSPPLVDPDSTSLLLRLHLAGGDSVAVFSSFNYDTTSGPFSFWNNIGFLHDESNPLIQFCPCSSDVVVGQGNGQADFDLKAIQFSGEGVDPDLLGENRYQVDEAYWDHKTGGMPFYNQPADDLIDPVCDLLKDGWVHLIQLGYPTAEDDAPEGNWPFGETTFHLFTRKNSGEHRFQYCWG